MVTLSNFSKGTSVMYSPPTNDKYIICLPAPFKP
jgi:hypothetical protein